MANFHISLSWPKYDMKATNLLVVQWEHRESGRKSCWGMKHKEGRRATENEYFLCRLCRKAPRKFSGSADVVFPNSSIFIGSKNSPNLTKRKYEMKSHKGNSILVLFIPAFLFFFFFFPFHSTYSGLFCTSGNHQRGTRNSWAAWERSRVLRKLSVPSAVKCWALREGTETPGALQSSFHGLGILEAPLLLRLQTHSTKCQFSKSSRLRRAFEQIEGGLCTLSALLTWQSSSSSPAEQLSSHLCAPAAPAHHKGELKMHIPKGQQWNLLCCSEIWSLPCSWGYRAASLNSFFQVAPLKLLQILAPCSFKWVWKQFFGRKRPGFFLPQIEGNDEQNYHSALTTQSSNIQLMI